MQVRSIRGVRDILPPESYYWNFVEASAREVFAAFGYELVRTPIMEWSTLFMRTIGEGTDIVEKEMYSFKDRKDRSITLRPEGTAGVARAYLQHNMSAQALANKPSKLYYMGPMFRYERPQAGRYRQFSQIGVEVIGSSSVWYDIEVVLVALAILERCGVKDNLLKINNIGCNACRKQFIEALRSFASGVLGDLCDDCQVRYNKNVLRLLDCKQKNCNKILQGAPSLKDYTCSDCNTHFQAFKDRLNEYQVGFEEDPTIVRGLDYYTSVVFEIVNQRLGAKDAVAGGGRYDDLLKDMGATSAIPAVGFSFGVDRLVSIMSDALKKEVAGSKTSFCFVFAPPYDPAVEAVGIKMCMLLRRMGIVSEWADPNVSFKAQMRYANKLASRFVVIRGGQEHQDGCFVVKDMASGDQRRVADADIEQELVSLTK